MNKSRTEQIISKANSFLEKFSSESDRGAVLIALAYLDGLLGDLIQSRMVDEKDHIRKLLDYPGPLSTANARSDFAYALGWIGPQVFKDLSIIRKIRNRVAHTYEEFQFESNPTTDLCKKLQVAEFAGVRFRHNRDRFLISIAFLGLQLENLCGQSEKPNKGIDPPITPLGDAKKV